MGKRNPWGLEAKPGQVGNTAVLEGEKEEEKGKNKDMQGHRGPSSRETKGRRK